jgi:hypothetical protein
MPSQKLTAALGYLARGWSVVPVAVRGKRPIVRWQTFEERHPTEAEVRGWFERWPAANVAVVTGAICDIVVLDVDPSHGGEASLARLALRKCWAAPNARSNNGRGRSPPLLQAPWIRGEKPYRAFPWARSSR